MFQSTPDPLLSFVFRTWHEGMFPALSGPKCKSISNEQANAQMDTIHRLICKGGRRPRRYVMVFHNVSYPNEAALHQMPRGIPEVGESPTALCCDLAAR